MVVYAGKILTIYVIHSLTAIPPVIFYFHHAAGVLAGCACSWLFFDRFLESLARDLDIDRRIIRTLYQIRLRIRIVREVFQGLRMPLLLLGAQELVTVIVDHNTALIISDALRRGRRLYPTRRVLRIRTGLL